MSHYDDLDLEILSAGRPFTEQPLTAFDVAAFPSVLRKLAAPGEPRPDENLMKYVADTQMGEAATPAEASVRTMMGAPDDTGHLEGEFAVPVEQVVMTLAQIVSNSMRQHAAYAYYGEMMRGLERAGLAELFEEQGEDELKEMHYFLRRMSVLQPGGVPIPPPPSPEPSDDPEVALRFLLAGEQQAIVLFKALHAQLGDNPMKYTLEQIQTDAQEHMDKLWQFMPQGAAQKQASVGRKLAGAVSRLKRAADVAALATPALGAEPIEQYLIRDQQLRLQQSEAEKQDLGLRLQQMQLMAVQQQAAAEQANAAAQQASMQTEQASQAAAASQQQAAAATEIANRSQQMAAQQAEAKMRLSMRIQQLRQQLADIVSSDPVSEELGGGQAAGTGAPATPGQQQEQQQQAEQQQAEQLAAERQQAAAVGGARARKEVEEAQKAEQNAQNQRRQAVLAEQGA
jgi:hypothetical protein